MLAVIAVEQVPDQAAIEVGGAEEPVHDREGEIHVHLHHDRLVVMGGVMPADGVHERHLADEIILLDVAAEMHELVDQIHRGGRRDEQPADIARDQEAEHDRRGDRHQSEHHQRIRREEGDAPVVMVGEAHLVLGEELMVHQRVAAVDGAEQFDARRPVHDVAVHIPFEEIAQEKRQRHREQFPGVQVVDVGDVDIEAGEADRVDDGDMQPAIVPAGHATAVIRAVIALPLGHFRGCQFHAVARRSMACRNISSAHHGRQAGRRYRLSASRRRTASSMSSLDISHSLSKFDTTWRMNGMCSMSARCGSPR